MKSITIKIIHFFILSCPEATLQIEKQLNGQVSWPQKIRLKIHLAVCKWCHSYNQKCTLIQRVLHKTIRDNSEKLNAQAIDTKLLKSKIEKKLKNNPS